MVLIKYKNHLFNIVCIWKACLALFAGQNTEKVGLQAVFCFIQACLRVQPNQEERQDSIKLEQDILGQAMANLNSMTTKETTPISWPDLENACASDTITIAPKNLITLRPPANKSLWPPELAEYHCHRNLLSVLGPVVLYKDRAIIPTTLRKEVLEIYYTQPTNDVLV